MKKTLGNSGYIGKDRRSTAGGIISQQKLYLERRIGRMLSTEVPGIITDELLVKLDGKIEPDGTSWADQSGNGNDFTLVGSPAYDEGDFSLGFDGGADECNLASEGALTSGAGTVCLVLKTTDVRGIFVGTGSFLGAYRSGNKYYNYGFGTPTFHTQNIERANIYDFIRTGEYIYIEFKDIDYSGTDWKFFAYGTYELGCDLRMILIYNKALSDEESTQNFNSLKSNGYI